MRLTRAAVKIKLLCFFVFPLFFICAHTHVFCLSFRVFVVNSFLLFAGLSVFLCLHTLRRTCLFHILGPACACVYVSVCVIAHVHASVFIKKKNNGSNRCGNTKMFVSVSQHYWGGIKLQIANSDLHFFWSLS